MPGFLFFDLGFMMVYEHHTWMAFVVWFVSAHHGLQLTWQLNLRRICRPTLDPFFLASAAAGNDRKCITLKFLKITIFLGFWMLLDAFKSCKATCNTLLPGHVLLCCSGVQDCI
jgi:hypothetical protein